MNILNMNYETGSNFSLSRADGLKSLRIVLLTRSLTLGGAQRQLPPDIRALAREVAVHYERSPAEDVIAEGFEPDILGLFTGNPHGILKWMLPPDVWGG